MTYKASITTAMDEMARDPDVCFLSYGIRHGKAMGTLKNVSEAQLIETPIAENLMAGIATGLSLRGKKPVVFIERADFALNALDAIVNHLCKIALMSRGQFKPAAIFRIIVGNKEKPLFTGETHVQDFCMAFRELLRVHLGESACVMKLVGTDPEEYIGGVYKLATDALERGISTFIFEYKDAY